jgi:hypothetical protein
MIFQGAKIIKIIMFIVPLPCPSPGGEGLNKSSSLSYPLLTWEKGAGG